VARAKDYGFSSFAAGLDKQKLDLMKQLGENLDEETAAELSRRLEALDTKHVASELGGKTIDEFSGENERALRALAEGQQSEISKVMAEAQIAKEGGTPVAEQRLKTKALRSALSNQPGRSQTVLSRG
jgi:hypothetical protein